MRPPTGNQANAQVHYETNEEDEKPTTATTVNLLPIETAAVQQPQDGSRQLRVSDKLRGEFAED